MDEKRRKGLSWIGEGKKRLHSDPLNKKTSKVKKSGTSRVKKGRTSTDKNIGTSEVRKSESTGIPKYETFEALLTVRLDREQLDFISDLTWEIMNSRKNLKGKRERITKNSIIRMSIEALRGLDIDIKDIPDEAELLRRIKRAMKR